LGNLVDFNLANNSFVVHHLPQQELPNTTVGFCLALSPDGKIWTGTSAGLFVFSPADSVFSTFDYSYKPQLKKASVLKIIFDKQGQAFMATANAGLLRYLEKPVFLSLVSDRDKPKGLPTGWADKLLQAVDGNIWLHAEGNLAALNPDTYTVVERPAWTNNNNYVSAFWQAAPGTIIYALPFGEVRATPTLSRQGSKIQLPGLPSSTHIRRRLLDSRGNEWLGTLQGLYRKAKDSTRYRLYDVTKTTGASPNANAITILLESSRHQTLWFGGDFGLYRYHYQGDSISRVLYKSEQGPVLQSQDLSCLYEDTAGILWIGQWQGGLTRFDPATGEEKHYGINDGLPDMAVQAIAADQDGILWMSSFNGLSWFNPATEEFNNFTIEDGLQSSQFADGSVLKTPSGDILFGGSNGVTVVHPSDFKDNFHVPPVFITGFKVFNTPINRLPGHTLKQPIYDTKRIELEHDENNLTIDFVAIHYSNPGRNRYAVFLENYDNDWRQLENQRQAYYAKLPPGRYVFRVKASNDRGMWNETGASIEIIIHPPWWKTWWAYVIYGLIFIAALYLADRYQRKRLLEKAKAKAKEKELEQAREIEKAYHELKATQQQLIHSEKMASLGELTAGIAHEIQNPLNFVNNFSEVSYELIDELNEELDKGDIDEAKAIGGDIKENLEKITHHGKRADAIVKGMLQHSRTSTGEKEPTDINALCDEYLRLAYHGLRAKDKSFNAKFETHFDESVPKLNVVSQDIGRVVLNLINNAFYAVNERLNAERLTQN
ncbi:MAG TPA: triple tyrosine motif-containing protein, partial [Bacteroidales bacterium]|nr:triple tyrosine motif-containing protein [Bacteroidales bacterium]